MAKYKTKSDYTALKKLHERTEKGSIFEHDIMTINPMQDLFTEGQDIIISDSNFKFSTRTDADESKKHVKNSWVLTPSGKTEWTLNDIDSTPISNESEVRIKPNYTSIKDFAYYGSAIEMIRATVNHVIMYFPAELYFTSTTFKEQLELDNNNTSLGEYGSYLVVSNQFKINVDVDFIDENKVDNPYRYLCLYGSSYDVYADGQYQSSGLNKSEFIPNNICGNGVVGTVTITGKDFSVSLTEYLYNNETYLLYTDNSLVGYSIRPNEAIINEYFNTIDEFESVLLNKDSNPKYKAIFETPYETDSGNKYSMVSYIWPSLNNWNPLIEGIEYEIYVNSLIDLSTFHDEYDSNIIWRMLTHEAIKNLDWTFFRENGDDVEDLSKIDSSKIEAMLQLYGRQYDGLKRYIDSIKYANNITYDEKNNVPDYLLTDAVELGGFEAILPNATAKTDVVSDNLYSARTEGYSEVDANTAFMRNLKINEHYINSIKGTRNGIETVLGLLGIKEDEYKISEYVTVAYGNNDYCEFNTDSNGYNPEDVYPRPVGNVRYPSAKDVAFVNLNKNDSTLDDYNTIFDGIPVKAFRCMDKSLWELDENNERTIPTYYVVPWYENGKHYDGNWYFQSKGGWAKTNKKEINKPELTSATTLEYDKIYGETQTYLKIAESISEMLGYFANEVTSGTVCYVNDISDIDEYASGLTDVSQYFILKGDVLNEISDSGWINIKNSDIKNLNSASTEDVKKVVYLETIIENTLGNNPHVGKGKYDDGKEYLDYMNQIFKYQLDLGDDGLLRLSAKDKFVVSDYTFGIDTDIDVLIEDNRKCDYFFNPNSSSTLSCSSSCIIEEEREYPNPEYGEPNAEPAANSVVNVKNMNIYFRTSPQGCSNISQEWQKYITNVVMEYVKQMIPSTTIFKWEFNDKVFKKYLELIPSDTQGVYNE